MNKIVLAFLILSISRALSLHAQEPELASPGQVIRSLKEKLRESSPTSIMAEAVQEPVKLKVYHTSHWYGVFAGSLPEETARKLVPYETVAKINVGRCGVKEFRMVGNKQAQPEGSYFFTLGHRPDKKDFTLILGVGEAKDGQGLAEECGVQEEDEITITEITIQKAEDDNKVQTPLTLSVDSISKHGDLFTSSAPKGIHRQLIPYESTAKIKVGSCDKEFLFAGDKHAQPANTLLFTLMGSDKDNLSLILMSKDANLAEDCGAKKGDPVVITESASIK